MPLCSSPARAGRRTAKSACADESELLQDGERPPLDEFGGGTQGLAEGVEEPEQAQGCVGERGETLGQAGTLGVMPILVPPAVFEEMKAVFDLPVAANGRMKSGGRHGLGGTAGHEVARVVKRNRAVGLPDLTIGTDGDLAARKVQAIAEIRGIVQVEPDSAGIPLEPLFSVISWAGRAVVAAAKQVVKASRTSG